MTPNDISEAEISIIGFTQQERFHNEFYVLSSGKCGVKKDSTIYKTDPVLEDGLLRVGGRLIKAATLEETKHPVILWLRR